MVCTQQIQFWKIAAVTFDILYILCTLNRVLRPILGDRFILMCRSWYSGVDLLEFHGQSKLFSHIYFLRFLGNHSSAAPEKKKIVQDLRNFRLNYRNIIDLGEF